MLKRANAIKDYIISARRDIHQHPELGYQEAETAKYIVARLDALGVSCKTAVGDTGVIAEISQGKGPTVLVRADMDALPIQEDTGLSFQSKIPGVMHACGHDTHSAMVLGAVKLLKEASFKGTIRFLFQPAEEGNYDDPDGFSGAQRAIVEGVLSGVDAAIGLHQIPTIETGKIAITMGSVMAAADFFEITIFGKSSHAGVSPEAGIDAVLIAAELVVSMQSIVSRQVSPKDTAVVSISTIEGGTAANIVADKVRLSGTIRAMKETTRETLMRLIKSRCDAYAAMFETTIQLNFYYGVPATINNTMVSNIAADSARKIFGDQQVLNDVSIMGGEDFAYIAQEVPSCFALLGTRVPTGEVYPLHSSRMIVNEDALPMGAAYLSQAALDLLDTLANK